MIWPRSTTETTATTASTASTTTTASIGAAERPVHCPYLGLADDPDTHFAFPSGAQRCHATSRPFTIDASKQARDCLTAQHVDCPRYHPPTTAAARGQLLERVSGEHVAPAALAEPRRGGRPAAPAVAR